MLLETPHPCSIFSSGRNAVTLTLPKVLAVQESTKEKSGGCSCNSLQIISTVFLLLCINVTQISVIILVLIYVYVYKVNTLADIANAKTTSSSPKSFSPWVRLFQKELL